MQVRGGAPSEERLSPTKRYSSTMVDVAVAQAFAFFCVCLSLVLVTEKKQLFVPAS